VISLRFFSARAGASLAFLTALASLSGCSDSSDGSTGVDMMPTTADGVVKAMRDSILTDIKTLRAAASAMVAAAPAATDRGWDASQDRAAIDATKAAWRDARTAYEYIEGATAPIFPDIDTSIDARYDDFLAMLPNGDRDPFDDQGVTGLHAVERILYADAIPARVVTFESTLTGYVPAAFPSDGTEASEFRTKLLPKMVADAQTLQDGWTPANINLNDAFGGLISLMNEQQEKVNKAATGEEESRYSQRTMTDIRDNLEGTKKIYALFSSWLRTKTNTDATMDGRAIDAKIMAGFSTLDDLYSQTQGEAIPTPPDSWSAENPSALDLATDFGKLYAGIHAAVAHDDPNSIVYNMNQAATLFGFDQFNE